MTTRRQDTEMEVIRLMGGGKQQEAEALLRNACNVCNASGSASTTPAYDKAWLLAWLLELRVQDLCVSRDKQRFADCMGILGELQDVLRGRERDLFSRPEGGSVLSCRYTYWTGKLLEIHGDLNNAVMLYCASVQAAKRGGGSVSRCAASAGQAYYSLGKSLFACGHLRPAIDTILRALSFANEHNFTPLIVDACVLGYKVHRTIAMNDKAASQHSSAADNNVKALQLMVLGLKQLRTRLPVEVTPEKVAGMLRECKKVLDTVVPLYPRLSEHVGNSKPFFASETERVMTDVSLVYSRAITNRHLTSLKVGMDWLSQSAKDLEHAARDHDRAASEENAKKKRKVQTSDGQVQTENVGTYPTTGLAPKAEPEA